MKQIKMISLLQKISKGIQPYKIKYDNHLFTWYKVGMFGGDYYCEECAELFDTLGHYISLSTPDVLNEKVEIIEN